MYCCRNGTMGLERARETGGSRDVCCWREQQQVTDWSTFAKTRLLSKQAGSQNEVRDSGSAGEGQRIAG